MGKIDKFGFLETLHLKVCRKNLQPVGFEPMLAACFALKTSTIAAELISPVIYECLDIMTQM